MSKEVKKTDNIKKTALLSAAEKAKALEGKKQQAALAAADKKAAAALPESKTADIKAIAAAQTAVAIPAQAGGTATVEAAKPESAKSAKAADKKSAAKKAASRSSAAAAKKPAAKKADSGKKAADKPSAAKSKAAKKIKVLFAASEAAPFVKTGGLADVVGSLPAALSKSCDARVILPLYESIDGKWRSQMKYLGNITVGLAWRNLYCGLFSLERGGVTYYFIDNEYYFKRREIYGCFDDAERFAFFSKAVLDVLPMLGYTPDIIHCSDWQTALVPIYLRTLYKHHSDLSGIKTVFTIHNIQYQGRFGSCVLGDVFGLGADCGIGDALEFYKDVNLMKGAICFADYVTTVSPSYSGDIQNPYYAYGLNGILSSNSGKLCGIINALDTDVYNPDTDPHLFKNYSARDFSGKAENKTALLKLLGLREANEYTPVIAVVSRLVSSKGMDLLCGALDQLMQEDIRLVILGTGDWNYEQCFKDAVSRYNGKLSANIMFSTDMANKIYAGSDILLMPSKSEPCGLAQLIALRYGTIPLVRETGGLRDTITPYNEYTGEGNGFSFSNYNMYDMLHVIRRAIGFYKDKNVWNKLVARALSGDYSWKTSAVEYENLYKRLLSR